MGDIKTDLKKFSDNQHNKNRWNSKNSYPSIPLLKYVVNYISLKRLFIYKLSKTTNSDLALDMGSGKGAYSKWFIIHNKKSKIVSMDWSFTALKNQNANPRISRVVADAQFMPFKSEIFDTAFSIDTLGHIENPEKSLDELYRVVKKTSCLFIHSECADYKYRWPDKTLINKLGKDFIAEKDGHFFIKRSSELYNLFHRRFRVDKFISPAGLTGWLTGYPENYNPLFKKAKMTLPFLLTLIPSIFRSLPLFKQLLQIVNSSINRIEIYFNISGGGSVFAFMRKER